MFSVTHGKAVAEGFLVDPGEYEADVLDASWEQNDNGTEFLRVKLRLYDDREDRRGTQVQKLYWRNADGDELGMGMGHIVQLAEAVGAVRDDRPETRDMMDQPVVVILGQEKFQGRPQNKVQGFIRSKRDRAGGGEDRGRDRDDRRRDDRDRGRDDRDRGRSDRRDDRDRDRGRSRYDDDRDRGRDRDREPGSDDDYEPGYDDPRNRPRDDGPPQY